MRWEGWAGAILVDGCGGLGSGQYGGQNARTSKHSAVRRMGWCNPGGVLWRLRVRSICVAKIQRFPSILNSFARLGCRLGRLGRVVERLGGHAGGGDNGEGPRRCSPQLAIFGGVGGLSCVLGGYSGASGGLFGAPGGLLGGLLRRLGASWGHLGAS